MERVNLLKTGGQFICPEPTIDDGFRIAYSEI